MYYPLWRLTVLGYLHHKRFVVEVRCRDVFHGLRLFRGENVNYRVATSLTTGFPHILNAHKGRFRNEMLFSHRLHVGSIVPATSPALCSSFGASLFRYFWQIMYAPHCYSAHLYKRLWYKITMFAHRWVPVTWNHIFSPQVGRNVS